MRRKCNVLSIHLSIEELKSTMTLTRISSETTLNGGRGRNQETHKGAALKAIATVRRQYALFGKPP